MGHSAPARFENETDLSPSAATLRLMLRTVKSMRARERILDTAYELFSHRGLRVVGLDTIVSKSGVARMTLYRHFASKDALVLAFLERREQRWTKDWLQRAVERRASDPRERLLAIFDVFDEWFHQTDFEGCAFINVLLEIGDPTHVLHHATRRIPRPHSGVRGHPGA